MVPVEARKRVAPCGSRAKEQEGLPFVAPRLQAFTIWRELLLLDPIHEIGDEGRAHASGAAGKLISVIIPASNAANSSIPRSSPSCPRNSRTGNRAGRRRIRWKS